MPLDKIVECMYVWGNESLQKMPRDKYGAMGGWGRLAGGGNLIC